MPNAPLVSVITPSYNQAEFLEATMASVFSQTYPNIEYIVIDGGSTDGSVEIIKRYQDRLAYWVSEKDAGQADAINKGFFRATGQYLTWLNSDDILYPTAIASLVDFLSSNPDVDFVYGDVDRGFDNDAKSLMKGKALSFPDMLRTLEVPIPQQGSLWKKTVVDQIGGLDPRWQVVLDREFFMRIAERFTIAYQTGRLGYFRQHPTAKSVAQQTQWLEELPKLYHEFFARTNIQPEIARLHKETLGILGLQCSILALRNGMIVRAMMFLRDALSADPLLVTRRGFWNMLLRFVARKVD